MDDVDDATDPNPVYYRLYLHDGVICVVTMQWFDELDYKSYRFVQDADDRTPMRFARECDARWFANQTFRREAIHPDDLLPSHPSFLLAGDEGNLRDAATELPSSARS